MSEPFTPAAAAITVGSVTFIGTIFGMQYSLLLIGLFAGLIRLGQQKRESRTNAVSTVALSSLMAGAVAPVVAAYAEKHYSLGPSKTEAMEVCAAFILGYAWQTAASLLTEAVRARFAGWSQK